MDRRTHAADTALEFPDLATGESAQMRGFATGVDEPPEPYEVARELGLDGGGAGRLKRI